MTYLTQSAIAWNSSLRERIAQCATVEQIPNPDAWMNDNMRRWAAAPGWAEAWEYALASHPDEPDFDPGKDEAVITDGMILSQVQAMHPPSPPEPPPEET